jgi:hypothetical protein
MPKKKTPKTLTDTLYAYVEPTNRRFALRMAKKLKIEGGYSGLINSMLTDARKKFENTKAV